VSRSIASTLARIQRTASIVAGVGALLLVLGFVFERERCLQAYLTAYLYVLAPALGSLGIAMLHNMTGGGWGFAIRRLLEAAQRTLPALALMFVPIALGVRSLYAWSHADVVAADPVLAQKARYLNYPFFLGRAVVYFAVWTALALLMVKLSERYDRKLATRALRRLKLVSGVGVVVYVLTMTFAAIDWAMSLEPHWYSTIYGLHFVVGQGLSTLCFATAFAAVLARHEPFSRWLAARHFHDLGNLTMAFVMLWAYVAFSQFLIIWSGDLPEENVWYLARTAGSWQTISVVLVAAHFALPFAVLLVRRAKRDPAVLARVVVALLVVRYLDFYWLIAPAFAHGEFAPHPLDLVAPVTLGAAWIALFVHNLHGRPLVSLQDAKLLGDLEVHPS